MKKIIKIIDAHTHVFPDKIAEKCRISVGTFYDLPMYTSGTISELEKIRNIHFMQDGIEYRIARQLICSAGSDSITDIQYQSFYQRTSCRKSKSTWIWHTASGK